MRSPSFCSGWCFCCSNLEDGECADGLRELAEGHLQVGGEREEERERSRRKSILLECRKVRR